MVPGRKERAALDSVGLRRARLGIVALKREEQNSKTECAPYTPITPITNALTYRSGSAQPASADDIILHQKTA